MNRPLPKAYVDLKQAMAAADLEELERSAIELGQNAVAIALAQPPEHELARELAEQERRDREDDAAAYSMEILTRWRQRVNRSKWTRSDGIAQHKIIEALRALPGDE